MTEVLINDEDCTVLLKREWLTKPEKRYNMYTEHLDLKQYDLVVYGKPCKTPRLQYAAGDSGSKAYKYSGSNIPLNSWDNTEDECLVDLRLIRDLIAADDDISMATNELVPNSCLINYYRNGADNVGWHGDKETRDSAQSVVTISLGTTRTFKLRHNLTNETISINLDAGDLLLMCGETQKLWKHTIPKVSTNKCGDGRISLTYRVI